MKFLLLPVLVIPVIFLSSCSIQTNDNDKMLHLVQEWQGKKIYYPTNTFFTKYGNDTIYDYIKSGTKFSIVSYIDSLGCLSCLLQLKEWKKIIAELKSDSIPVKFFFHPKTKDELLSLLKEENFDLPVCIDMKDSFRILNKISNIFAFRTFLLDSDNRIIAIGNPAHNPKVKELYLNIIQGKMDVETDETVQTVINVKETTVSLGRFDWQEAQKATFTIENVGDQLLVIHDVATSCGCTSVEYSKEPVPPGKHITLQVVYQADQPEYFNKTLTVYCNVKPSLLKLHITGNAEDTTK